MIKISPVKLTQNGYFKNISSDNNSSGNSVKYNNLLAKDTVSFSGTVIKKSQREDAILGINASKYHPYEQQVRAAEKSRRKLQYDADILGIKLNLPEQEDFAEAIAVRSELMRGETKIKQALKNSTDIKKALRISRAIKDAVPADKKEKAEAVLNQYDEAKRIFDEGVLDIKINALLEIVGQDKRDLINREKFKKTEQIKSEYMKISQMRLLLADILGVDPDDQSDILFEKATEYNMQKSYRLMGIKTPNPTEEEVWDKIAMYEQGLLKRKIITKTELTDMQY